MKSRMKNAAMVMPEALQALLAFGKTAENGSVPVTTIQLAQLRASQINGCSVCVDMHYQYLKEAGETPERCVTVSAWRDTPYFSDAERAALALAEAVTRLDDRPDPVPDDVWDEAARHYTEEQLAALGRDRDDQRVQPRERGHQTDHRRVDRPDRSARRQARRSR